MNKNRAYRQKGFTLIELLVGVTIAVAIFLTATSVMALLFRSDLKTKRVEQMQQARNDLQVEFTNTIKWAQIISFTQGNKAELTLDQNTYKVSGDRLLRNNDPITPSNVVVTRFQVKDYSLNADTKSLEITIDLENKNNATVKDSIRINVSQRKTEFEQK